MKLRVRLNKQTCCVELDGPEPTLTDLRVLVKEVLLPSNGLSADTEFSLSLNGKESLVDTGQTLSSCGVVGGDLVSVILSHSTTSFSTNSASSISTPTQKSGLTQQNSRQDHGVMQTSTYQAESSSSHSSSSSSARDGAREPKPAESTMTDEEEEEAVESFIPEPMLCSEAGQRKVPHALQMLFQAAECRTSSDCLLVAAHLLLLESGFLPQATEIRNGEMPSGWRAAGGVYRLQYTHPHCENSLVCMAAVQMGQNLILNATLKRNSNVEGTWKLVLNPSGYVTEDWTGQDAAAVYKDLPKLSCVFKDQLAYPLIAAARQALGLPALFGLAVLPPELLLRVLRLLDVHSVLSMSVVCTHLHFATQDPILWRHLLLRDFRVCIQDDAKERDTDWKQLYQKRDKEKKERGRYRFKNYFHVSPMPSRPPIPPVPLPFYPPGIIGGEYDQRLGIPRGPLPRPRYDPIGPLPGHEPGPGLPFFRRTLRPGGNQAADIRRGFI